MKGLSAAPSGAEESLSFPGMELFSDEVRKELAHEIEKCREEQPKSVIEICAKAQIGWTKSGNPDTIAINHVEQEVIRRGCLWIALRTLSLLQAELDPEVGVSAIMATNFNYERIPEAIYKAVKSL